MPNNIVKYKNKNSLTKKSLFKTVQSVMLKSLERKSRVYGISDIECNASGFLLINQVQDLSRLDQGEAAYERVGNSVTPTYFQMRYQCTIGSPEYTNVVRFILFQYLEDSSVAPIMSDFLMLPPAPAIDNVYALYQRNMKDIRILHDRTITLDNSKNLQYVGKLNVNLGKKLTGGFSYNDTSTNGKGHIFVIFFSDSAAAAHPKVSYQAKLTYRDG